MDILERIVFGNRVMDYLAFVVTALVGILVISLVHRFLLKHLRKAAKRTETTLDDFLVTAIEKIALPPLYFGAFYLGVKNLKLSPAPEIAVKMMGVAIFTFSAARLLIHLITYGIGIYSKRIGKTETMERSLPVMLRVIKGIVWGLAVVLFLDNMGIKVSSVLAGIGIGGIAIGLASQAILKDLFSYFSIIFDRPFEIGDFVIVGDCLGTVEYIGAKTTRIRSLGGEQLIFSNTDLTDSRVRNYKRMEKRRVVFSLGVTYGTPAEKLKAIPGVIEKIIKNIKDTVFDRAHFFSYGDFSLIFETVYYVIGPDYNKYMDVQQEINLAINEAFAKRGIEFAYPPQTLYVAKSEGESKG